jgi:hypothetical protein
MRRMWQLRHRASDGWHRGGGAVPAPRYPRRVRGVMGPSAIRRRALAPSREVHGRRAWAGDRPPRWEYAKHARAPRTPRADQDGRGRRLTLDGTLAGWGETIALIAALFVLDLFVSRPGHAHARVATARAPASMQSLAARGSMSPDAITGRPCHSARGLPHKRRFRGDHDCRGPAARPRRVPAVIVGPGWRRPRDRHSAARRPENRRPSTQSTLRPRSWPPPAGR